ncbi:MAG: 4'-phosphopantetheinyl transferase superfamily protein [Lachnospiraceae bacterium]|nr:4'-phosphopantetheinyl transferase superfamily protein [Lachnospiraceae bacterium]
MNKIYISQTKELTNDELFRRLYYIVSEERRKKIDKLVFRKDKILSLAAGILLKKSLSDIGINEFCLEYGKYGKPYIKNKNIFFNLSHSEDMVMCAVSDMEIGCDVEKISDIDMEIAKRFFCVNEYEMIKKEQSDEKKKDMFFRLWTLKESFLKATGYGMSLSTNSFCISIENKKISVAHNVNDKKYYFTEYDYNDGYKYAVCGLSPYFDDSVEFVGFRAIYGSEH